MIIASFEFPAAHRRQILEAFLSLPHGLRPTHESDDERDIGRALDKTDDAIDRLTKRDAGFFLKTDEIMYDINYAGSQSIVCNCFLDYRFDRVFSLMAHIAQAQPIFGFACVPEERARRNQLLTVKGVNTIKAWVGRSAARFLPGLYWMTLIGEELVRKHNIPLADLENASVSHWNVETDYHLFQFYDHPSDWKMSHQLDEIYLSIPSIFQIDKIAPEVDAARNYL